MADFTQPSTFNKDANFESVKFGGNAPLLETELNELQDIQNYKRAELARAVTRNGVKDVNDITWVKQSTSDVKVSIKSTTFALEGEIVTVPNLEKVIKSGESLYLKVSTIVITPSSTIKKGGNIDSSETVPNNLIDDRLNVESANRNQVTYSLTTSNTDTNAKYLLIGKNISGEFNVEIRNYSIEQEALFPGEQGDLVGDIIPTNADLLGGKNKDYFEALVNEVSQGVTENFTNINVLNNNLASKSQIINGDILAWALTCGKGITDFYATEPLSNIPSGVATYSIGYVLRGSATPTSPTRVLLFNRIRSDIYVNTFHNSSWLGWTLLSDGGNASTVGGKTVGVDVPSNAKFTDTVTTINGKTGTISKTDITALGIPAQDTKYTHPTTHPASMITGLPSSLPANGGNSNTVGGFKLTTTTTIPTSLATNTICFVYE